MSPVRVQLRRSRGWRKPAGAIMVARPTRWGNPFKVAGPAGGGLATGAARAAAVDRYRLWLTEGVDGDPHQRAWILEHLAELDGRDLCCWCPPGQPCHADVLLALANPDPQANGEAGVSPGPGG